MSLRGTLRSGRGVEDGGWRVEDGEWRGASRGSAKCEVRGVEVGGGGERGEVRGAKDALPGNDGWETGVTGAVGNVPTGGFAGTSARTSDFGLRTSSWNPSNACRTASATCLRISNSRWNF